MRIALVVHDFDRAIGHGRYCYEISKRLAPQHHIDVWANRFAAPAQSNLAFRQVPAWRKSAMLTVLTFLWASEKRLRRERYDLIHAQGLTCWNADVITAHVCNAARLKQTPLEGRHRVFAMIAGALERKFYHQRQARHLIAISKRVADEITAHYAWRGSVSVIYHGIDTTQFRPVEDSSEKAAQRKSLPLSKADWVWLFVGEAIKGLDKVIEQLPRFPDAKLLVISRSHLDTFRQRALKLGVADRIQFCGPSNELAPIYQAADVFIYPSDYDAFGLVVAEAMATGLPVIVGQNIGAAEWIIAGQNGLTCDPQNRETISAALQRLRADREFAARLGLNARETALRHTWDKCAEETGRIYDAAISNGKP